MQSIRIIYASTSGHTEYVVETLVTWLREKGVDAARQMAEKTTPEDLLRGDLLILASSTWNTGNVEGQLNPHMWTLLLDRAKSVDLGGKNVALIALGDERYFYTANASKHLEEFVTTHGGTLIVTTLKIINEPYGQEEKIRSWGKELLSHLQS